LKTPPGGAVLSLQEIFAIAQAMERDTYVRYRRFALQAHASGAPELADLFDRLADEEQHHEQSVVEWARRDMAGRPDASQIRWQLPSTFEDDTAAELAASRTADPYRILAMAVRTEERAFTFWSYVAAEAPDDEVRRAAETMALEELRHVSLLRRARRKAYREQRRGRLPAAARSAGDRLSEAAALELRLADDLQRLALRLRGAEGNRASNLAAQSRLMARQLGGGSSEMAAGKLSLSAAAERLVDDYLESADLAENEDTALLMQSLARQAIERLSWLRDQKELQE